MREIPDFDVELSQAMDYIMSSPLAQKAFMMPPFPQYTIILQRLIQAVDRLADNCHMPEFTNHALPHICSIVRRASEWAVEDQWLNTISEREAGYLLLALVIHDIGMLSQDAQDLQEQDRRTYMRGFGDIAGWVRKTHVVRLQGLVLRLLKEEIQRDCSMRKEEIQKDNDCSRGKEERESKNRMTLQDHMMIVINMAASHQCWAWEENFMPETAQALIDRAGLDRDRIAALNAVIAVSDLLDEDSNRCDTIGLIRHRHGTTENMAHWIRHALTAQVDGVRGHKVTVTFRKLLPEDERYETIYRALRNHYRLVKLYNVKLKKLNAQIEQICFLPPDGLRDLLEDETARELEKVWQRLPEFEDHIVEQILSTFMREALNEDGNDPLMRRRLDELGLETLDLSREERFIHPPTIYYPEEKLLFVEKDYRKQLSYIKAQVDDAYLNGEMGKVRHLCQTALKCWKEPMSLNETYWIFVYIAVFPLDGDEMDFLRHEYENSLWGKGMGTHGKLIMEGPYQPLLDVLLLLLEPASGEEWYEKYRKRILEGDFTGLQEDMTTELLLETIIGLLWYYDPEGTLWSEIAAHFEKKLSDTMGNKIATYKGQLAGVSRILYHVSGITEEDYQRVKDPLEKAWIAFWQDDSDKKKENKVALCQKGNSDHDYMGAVQAYLNLTRWDELTQEEEEKKKDSIIESGGYRYQRIIMERPMSSFWNQRILKIKAMLNRCRQDKQNTQLERIYLIRLIALHMLDALRYWDVWQYIEAVRARAEEEFISGTYVDKYGKYCGDTQALRRCLIDNIRGLSEKAALTKEERKIAAHFLVKHEPDGVDDLVTFITEQSVPLQWQYVMESVEVLAAAFSKDQRKKLIHWLCQYETYYHKQGRFMSTTRYLFLKEWLPDLDVEDWTMLRPLFEVSFQFQTTYMVNAKLGQAFFKYAPWDMCEGLLKRMETYPDNVRKSMDIYGGVLEMAGRGDADDSGKEMLREFVSSCDLEVAQKLEGLKQAEKLQDDEENDEENEEASGENLERMQRVYEETEKLIKIKKLRELEPVDIEFVEQELERFEKGVAEKGSLSGYDSTFMDPVLDTFRNKNWRVQDETGLLRLLDRLFALLEQHSGDMSMFYFTDFCHLFYFIEATCSDRGKAYINDFVIKHMIRHDFFEEQRRRKSGRHWDGPYERFRFDQGSGTQYDVCIMMFLAHGMTALQEEDWPEVIRYLIEALNTGEDVICHYAVVILSYYLLNRQEAEQRSPEAEKAHYLAWGAFYIIREKMMEESRRENKGLEVETEIRKWVKKAIDALKESDQWFGVEGYMEKVQKNEMYRFWLQSLEDCGKL